MKNLIIEELRVIIVTIKEMSNEQLMRYYICTKRELKTLQSTLKQQEDELNRRFDNGTLIQERED